MSDLHATAAGLVQPCPSCGKKNRRPYARLLETARCGACGGALEPRAIPWTSARRPGSTRWSPPVPYPC